MCVWSSIGLTTGGTATSWGIAWEVGFSRDIVISTLTFSQQEFAAGPLAASPIVTSILQEGVAV